MGFFDKIKNATQQLSSKIGENLSQEKLSSFAEKIQNTMDKVVDKAAEKVNSIGGDSGDSEPSPDQKNITLYTFKFAISNYKFDDMEEEGCSSLERLLNWSMSSSSAAGLSCKYDIEKGEYKYEATFYSWDSAEAFRIRVEDFRYGKGAFNYIDVKRVIYTLDYDLTDPNHRALKEKRANKAQFNFEGMVEKARNNIKIRKEREEKRKQEAKRAAAFAEAQKEARREAVFNNSEQKSGSSRATDDSSSRE